nr:MAM and LDL-receptor class A domain-containing protein 1-like [Lytechinus pictus]
MYTEADLTSIGQSARLNSALFTPITSDSCLTFWYHMHGEQVGVLNVLLASGSAETMIWTRSGTQGDQWLVARVPVSGTAPVSVIFEGIMTGDPRSDIALDDILLENDDCLAVTPSPGAFSPFCDFEYGFAVCGYSQESLVDDFDWSLGSGPTDTALTGPSSDHTTRAAIGKYMFIETDPPRIQGDKAWLYSHTFPAAGSHCFEFYYHMYGDNIGSLNVLIETGGLFSQPYFTLSGNLGNQWNVARIPLNTNDDFQVYFEATVGDGILGNIAIDDVDMYAGSCLPPGKLSLKKTPPPYFSIHNLNGFLLRRSRLKPPGGK